MMSPWVGLASKPLLLNCMQTSKASYSEINVRNIFYQSSIAQHRCKEFSKTIKGLLYTVNSNVCKGFLFRETSLMRSFVKIKPLRNGKITLSFTGVGKSCLSREFLSGQYVF